MAAPRKTVTQALLDVRTNLDEADAAFFSDTRLIAYIDQAYSMVWSEVKKLKANYFDLSRTPLHGVVTILGESYDCGLLIVTDTGFLELPPDTDEVQRIECVTAGYEHVQFLFRPLHDPALTAARQFNLSNTPQPPSVFYCHMAGERLLGYAPPSAVPLALSVWYTPILDSLTTGADTIQLPHPLYLALVDFATARALMMDRAPEYAVWNESAHQHIARMFGSHARQSQDAAFVISIFD